MRNVATLVDLPARVDHELSPLSADQVATFLDAIDGDRLRALYVSAIGLGMRQGELLALRWSDVDLDAETVTVRHTLSATTRTLTEPKTDRARRTLRLPGEALDALRDHRRAQLAERLAATSCEPFTSTSSGPDSRASGSTVSATPMRPSRSRMARNSE